MTTKRKSTAIHHFEINDDSMPDEKTKWASVGNNFGSTSFKLSTLRRLVGPVNFGDMLQVSLKFKAGWKKVVGKLSTYKEDGRTEISGVRLGGGEMCIDGLREAFKGADVDGTFYVKVVPSND